ncbi:MAG: MATE family efflux transporter [Eubacteriales bacterium]|nr:MATE family efflux transporter [Eubacteriales bacterium]
MEKDLTRGNITVSMLRFALPLIAGNLMQQFYNVADTLIVGKFLGADALAAVGSSYTLMTFLTSILLGLAMGCGTFFSILYGAGDQEKLNKSIFTSFILLGIVDIVMNLILFAGIDRIMGLLNVPGEIHEMMREYLIVIFVGITATFLYNFFASVLRAVGNSFWPMVFLGAAALLNVGLDLLFVIVFDMGVEGAAAATVIAQYVSGVGLAVYTWFLCPELRPKRRHRRITADVVKELAQFSVLTCLQQSVMNLGILMVQGLVNSFGTVIMAAFAAAVKIDSFAYMPVQDFGNAFSTFIAQNYGAGKRDRIRGGIKSAVLTSVLFCLVISSLVVVFARQLMLIFVQPQETQILAEGVRYLRIEGSFYCLIGCLFLLYGFYRAMGRPGMSLVLTVISLGTRVVLAYVLSAIPAIGVVGIWCAVPIGWFLADTVGFTYLIMLQRKP